MDTFNYKRVIEYVILWKGAGIIKYNQQGGLYENFK